jgi:hypothetical protein
MNKAELLTTIEKSGFIFQGKVVPRRAPHAQEQHKIEGVLTYVLIEEVLYGTEVTRGLVHKEAILVRSQGHAPPEGAVRLFFSEVASLGDPILLRWIAEDEPAQATLRDFRAALEEFERRPLLRRVEAADLIITGAVRETEPPRKRDPRMSEHDPLWALAKVVVHSVLKGPKTVKEEVDVLFASSIDIAWYKAPKLREGMSGILLLHRAKTKDPKEGLPAIEGVVYLITDPLDYLPIDQLPAVQRALGRDAGGAPT